jgi:hypothetical protein
MNYKKSAALKTYIMWSWLEQTGRDKESYPLYKKLGYDKCSGGCFWCHHSNNYCEYCPLAMRGLSCDGFNWNTDDGLMSEYSPDDTPFRIWLNSWSGKTRNKEGRIAAGDIAAIAWEEYKKYEKTDG